MPDCPYCNKSVLNNSELYSVKDTDGYISISCKDCFNIHNLIQIEDHKKNKNSLNSDISKNQFSKIEGELLKKINSILDEISENNSLLENKESYKRAHERHDVSLEMQFSYVRDNKMYRARVLDISQGGMKFETEVPLEVNQHLKGQVFKPSENKENESVKKIENYMETRRVIALENGLFQIGVRFIKKISIDEKDRRKNVRKKGNFPFFFTREGSEITYKGTVIDISPGGMKAQVHISFEEKEIIEVFMKTRPPAFTSSDLSATFQIKRIERVYENCFNVSGSFDNLHVIQL
jgi:c-di-GMP-binding flagellar brake protein YcgR